MHEQRNHGLPRGAYGAHALQRNERTRRASRRVALALALFVTNAAATALAASVTVSPTSITVPVGGSRSFSATVSGAASTAVSWEVNGKPGGSMQDGTISPGGVYVGPATPTTVTVTARSVADPSASASSAVTVRWQVPWLTSVAPTALPVGASFTIDIVGSRFAPGAQAFLDGAALSTTRLSDTLLRATGSLASSQLGGLSLRVDNPGPVSSTLLSLVGVPGGTAGSPDPATLAAVRFLDRATFGATNASILELQQLGIDNWLAMQMDPAVTPPSQLPDGLTTSGVPSEWIRQMATAPDQLRQRVAFALSQIFVVSMWKNTNGNELSPFVRILSNNAFGNFRTLLQEVTLSPSMGKYLDMAYSKRSTGNNTSGANENYARELLQLFTIGTWKLDDDGLATLDADGNSIPTYDQNVIRNVAGAFTGWVHAPAPGQPLGAYTPPNFTTWMVPYEPSHDTSAKTIFDGIQIPSGMKTAAEMDLVLDRIFQHPNVPPFFATRLIRLLVTSNPSPEYVGRVSAVFRNNGKGVRGDLAAVVKAVLTDVEARTAPTSSDAVSGRLMDPILQVLATVRALGGSVVDPSQVLYLFYGLGEEPMAANTVFSFFSPLAPLPRHPELYGPEFQIYSPALAIQRANFVWNLLTGQLSTAFAVDITPYVTAAADPVALANLIDLKLFHGAMSGPLEQTIVSDGYALTDARQRATGALFLALTSSEFTVLR